MAGKTKEALADHTKVKEVPIRDTVVTTAVIMEVVMDTEIVLTKTVMMILIVLTQEVEPAQAILDQAILVLDQVALIPVPVTLVPLIPVLLIPVPLTPVPLVRALLLAVLTALDPVQAVLAIVQAQIQAVTATAAVHQNLETTLDWVLDQTSLAVMSLMADLQVVTSMSIFILVMVEAVLLPPLLPRHLPQQDHRVISMSIFTMTLPAAHRLAAVPRPQAVVE